MRTRILLNQDNKVADTTINGTFVITETECYIMEGNHRRLTYQGKNLSNAYTIELDINEPVIGKIYDKETGEFAIDIQDPNTSKKDIELINAPEYVKKRVAKYPDLGEQFDLLYWDKVNSTTKWQDLITGIKIECPKEI